jgi:crotonobetainyl-CoA:carnitine CoA-transferase CaiB-like acyl-CoA transferase
LRREVRPSFGLEALTLKIEDPRPADRPFDGLRILDLTTTFAGSLASMHIAHFGGDVLRVDGPPGITPEQIVANRCKRLASLDVAGPRRMEEVRALAQRADVVVVDASHAALRKSELDAPTIRRGNPGLIHLWMPPHATRGAVRDLPEDELLLTAWTGMADQQPGAFDQPVAPVVPIVAYEHGVLGATAIVAALLSRQKTGVGRGITVSGLHAVAALNVSTMVDVPGLVRPFSGEKSATWGPPNFRVYCCRDGSWLFLAALTAPFFIAALDAMGLLDVMVLPGVDGEFLNVFLPGVKPMVEARLAARFLERSGPDWQQILDSARVPNAPVQAREEWAASETVKAGAMLVGLRHEAVGEVTLPGPAVELCDAPGRVEWLFDGEAVVDPRGIWLEVRSHGGHAGAGSDARPPLNGLRVLDVSSFLAGPFASTVLENFGATVVKVEQSSGDPFGQVASATYAALNRGKSRVVLDLKDPADLRSFYTLAADCDAVIDNMSLGLAEKLGINFDELAKKNSDIVVCSISAWGIGPLKDTPGFDPLLQARSGLMAAQGGGGAPVVQAAPVTDIGTGTLGAFGVLTALFARAALGQGQQVRASLARTSLIFQAAEFTTFAQRPPPVFGNPSFLGESAHHRLYQCDDGWIAICTNERTLELLLHNHVALSDRDDMASGLRRLAVSEAVALMVDAGLPAVAVLGRDRLFGDPQLVENDFFFPVDDAALGPATAVRSFADWEDVPTPSAARTHGLGEDTSAVVRRGWPQPEVSA